MKTLILMLFILFTYTAHAEKNSFPFYKNEKYGKYRTQQKKYVFAKRDYKAALPFSVKHKSNKHKTFKNKKAKQKEAWIYRQWTRN